MAIFHLSVKLLSRSQGRCATAAAAYRSGQRITDRRQGLVFDYRRRKNMGFNMIFAPREAPRWATNRAELWNQVELMEKRKDAQTARLLTIALPHELNDAQHKLLLTRFVRRCFTSMGMIVDAAIHTDAHNKHAHLMVTLRTVTADGFGPKNRSWNSPALINHWRESWAHQCNAFLMARGHKERIDHRSLEDQAATSTQPQKEKEIPMKTTTRELTVAPKPARDSRGIHAVMNAIHITPDPMRSELFDNLMQCLQHSLRTQYPGSETEVTYSKHDDAYTLWLDNAPKVSVRRDGIYLATASNEEIALTVQLAIDMGWTGMRLTGNEDFKRRAYEEAVRRGFAPQSIQGYTPPTIQAVLTPPPITSSRPVNSPATRRLR